MVTGRCSGSWLTVGSHGWVEGLPSLPKPRKLPFTSVGSLMSSGLPWAVICSLDIKNAKSEQTESPSGWASSCYKQPVFELVIMSHGTPSLAQKWLILSKLSVFALLPNAVISHSVFFFFKGTFLLKEQEMWKENELHYAFQTYGPKSSSGPVWAKQQNK